MPPKGKLSEDQIKALERWVAMGAPDPREAATAKPKPSGGAGDAELPTGELTKADIEKGRAWWAYVQPRRFDAPSVKDGTWPTTDIDRFVLSAMEAKGLEPVKDAAAADLVRRVTFDLTGLPPTPGEVDEFLRDKRRDAYERLVDRLLASRAFAEHWGRHWLDVARYAESSGREGNSVYPYAWRYRDWVIDAFDDNLPYDQFLRHQLAGDLLPVSGADDHAAKTIATGFLAVGSKAQRTRSKDQFAMDLADEQIDAFSQAMLGTTIACARCHDHKFDPITQRDYYALAGIFLSTETYYGTSRSQGNQQPSNLIELPGDASVPNGPTVSAVQRMAYERIQAQLAQNVERQQGNQKVLARQASEGFAAMLARFDDDGRATAANRLAMGVREKVEDVDARILARGELDKAGPSVARGFPEVLVAPGSAPITLGSGRLQLADWVAGTSNPLTARVFVNRAWAWIFGVGIVPTPDNFGTSGVAPTHPELLDRLASDFMAGGWDVKALVRRLVLTRTYRLASSTDRENAAIDPDVTWLWRARERRLPAESIRDAMLACAGAIGEPPVGSSVASFEGGLGQRGDLLAQVLLRDIDARSVYLPVVRDFQNEALDAFDFADPSFVTGDRDETTVATQALYLMNDERVIELAMRMARRLMRMDATDRQRITFAFQLAFGREPSAAEERAVTSFLRDFHQVDQGAPGGATGVRERIRQRVQSQAGSGLPPDMLNASPEERAWTAFCQALFQTAEFRYLD
jgi:cytochrome c553